ncbi:hypothetical protein ACGFX2_18085 [Streptomyces goshikiensis]
MGRRARWRSAAAVYGGRPYVVNARFDSGRSDPAAASTIVSCPT